MVDELQQMLIEHACQKLIIEYGHRIDRHDAAGFAALFAQDAAYKPAAEPVPLLGREAIWRWACDYPAERLTRHLCTNILVGVLSTDRAVSSSYAVVFREPNANGNGISARVTPRAIVKYHDEFRRTGEGWKFSSRYYDVDFLEASESARPESWTK